MQFVQFTPTTAFGPRVASMLIGFTWPSTNAMFALRLWIGSGDDHLFVVGS
jgi:hypothetical protein